MKLFKSFTGVLLLVLSAAALAELPDEGNLFWWEMGVLLGIHSQLAACNEFYPEFTLQNESAYISSVFANPTYNIQLQKYPEEVPTDPKLEKLLSVVLNGRKYFRAMEPEILKGICSKFPQNIEAAAVRAFGMNSKGIKLQFLENKKTKERPLE